MEYLEEQLSKLSAYQIAYLENLHGQNLSIKLREKFEADPLLQSLIKELDKLHSYSLPRTILSEGELNRIPTTKFSQSINEIQKHIIERQKSIIREFLQGI
jgi:hypothetical protein